MTFQIAQLTYDFHSGNGNVNLIEQPTPPASQLSQVSVFFPLKPVPSGSTPDAATSAELKAEAKRILLAAAAAL